MGSITRLDIEKLVLLLIASYITNDSLCISYGYVYLHQAEENLISLYKSTTFNSALSTKQNLFNYIGRP